MGNGTDAVEMAGVSSSTQPTLAVLATTDEGTRCALLTAKRLTKAFKARIVLLVPRLHSVFAPFDPAGEERTTLLKEHRQLAAEAGLEVTALFCVCHRLDDVVHQMVGRSSLVVVGGRRNLLWPSREQRLVSRLVGEGYAVVFAQIGAAPKRGLVPVTSS